MTLLTDTARARAAARGSGERIHEMLSLIGHSSAGEAMAIMVQAGLTMPQIVTLHVLEHRGAHHVCEIADRLRLSRAATSHLVDQLARRAYVDRSEDQGDRRQKVVSISTKGRRLVDRLIASRQREFERAVALLPIALQDEFNRVLAKVNRHLKTLQNGHACNGGAR